VLAVAAIVVPLLVLAGSGQATLTAETYADVIRFGVQGAATLQIQIYDLSEKALWDSGAISSDFVDWDRTDTWGERLANGYYLYLAQAWDMSGSLILSKTGKVALLPGDQVQLQTAPVVSRPISGDPLPGEEAAPAYGPKGLGDTGVFGKVGIGTAGPITPLDVFGSARIGQTSQAEALQMWRDNSSGGTSAFAIYTKNAAGAYVRCGYFGAKLSTLTPGAENGTFSLYTVKNGSLSHKFGEYDASSERWFLNGNVGIGTTSPTKKLDVAGDAAVSGTLGIGTTNATARITVQGTSGDLIAAYNSSNRVFVVKSTGEVRADGAVYAASFNTGSADVAERVNTSEWVEAGDVVEIDPDHAGFFRKSADPYSRRVAGIISTSPGVILGNSTDSETGDWDDNRAVLAIAGRVPVRVTTENGPIQVGDLLVASSVPGVAMKGEVSLSVGAVVGKAMEPLDEGEGTIMAQVTLR
jgi:hypothetical protein